MSHSAPSSTPLRLPVLSLVSVGMIFGLTYGLSTPSSPFPCWTTATARI
ncbi:hypothetical protein [Acetobacter persici]|nr:hypothetical protein [Acetobacter persici]